MNYLLCLIQPTAKMSCQDLLSLSGRTAQKDKPFGNSYCPTGKVLFNADIPYRLINAKDLSKKGSNLNGEEGGLRKFSNEI
jgi:hypothetical protein